MNAYDFSDDKGTIVASMTPDGTVSLLDGGETIETYVGWKEAVRTLTGNEPPEDKKAAKKRTVKIAEGTKMEKEVSGTEVKLDPDNIVAGKNPRGKTPDPEQMAESLRRQADMTGDCLIHNIVVGPPNKQGKHPLIAGWTRHAAALLNKSSRPNKPQYYMLRAIVVDVDAGAARAMGLRENFSRKDMNALAVAKAFSELVEDGWNQKQIAKEFGYSNAHISNMLAILECKPIHKFIEDGTLGQTQAINIANLAKKDPEGFKVALKTIKESAESGKEVTTDSIVQSVRDAKIEEKEKAKAEKAKASGAESEEAESDESESEDEGPQIVKMSRKEIDEFLYNNTLPGADPLVVAICKVLQRLFNGEIKEQAAYNQLKKVNDAAKKLGNNGVIAKGKGE